MSEEPTYAEGDPISRALRIAMQQLAQPPSGEYIPDWSWATMASSDDAVERSAIWEAITERPENVFPVRLPWLNGTYMEFPSLTETAKVLFVAQSFDPNELSLLSDLLEPGMTFIDAGANVGMYAIAASKIVGESGAVFAFEPSRREQQVLAQNITLNRSLNVRTFPVALGDRPGRAILSVASAEFSGHNSLAGLSIYTKYPNIRYTVDGEDIRWTGFTGRTTKIPLGLAEHVEVVIYSDADFDIDLNSVAIMPENAITGPWATGEDEEVILEGPLAQAYASASISKFGALKVKESDSAINVAAQSEGGGISFRWELDSSVESMLVITGLPRSEGAVERYAVPVETLDNVLGGWSGSIDVLKVDVEGVELEVLAGARDIISRHRPLILVEVVNELLEIRNKSAQELANFLHSQGYIIFDVAGGKPRLVDLMGEHASNVFAVPERFLDQVLEIAGLDRSALTAGLSEEEKPKAKKKKATKPKTKPVEKSESEEVESDKSPEGIIEAETSVEDVDYTSTAEPETAESVKTVASEETQPETKVEAAE